MGLDGGTYITRSDVLRGQSWAVTQGDETRSTRGGAIGSTRTFKKRKLEGRAAKEVEFSTCTLTGEPLAPPVVADYLGHLYNKESVLEFLLARQGAPADAAAAHRYLNQLRAGGEAYDHLTSSGDVFAVRLGGAPQAPYRCPLTDLPCLAVPFAALSTCGHVFSERAVREMQAQQAEGEVGQATCALCGEGFGDLDVVPIHGSEEAVEKLRERERWRAPERRKQRKKRRVGEKGKGKGGAQAGSSGGGA